MILSAHSIREIRPVEPFIEATKIYGMTAGLSHCGYDIRIAQKVIFTRGEYSDSKPVIFNAIRIRDNQRGIESDQSGRFCLASTVERFTMPHDVCAVVHDKSTWARRGLSVFNTVIEPGWTGFLTLELVYHGQDNLIIEAGSPIAQVVFNRLDRPVDGYAGKYQDQADRPVAAILEDA